MANHAHLELLQTPNGRLREGRNWCLECMQQSRQATLGLQLADAVLPIVRAYDNNMKEALRLGGKAGVFLSAQELESIVELACELKAEIEKG